MTNLRINLTKAQHDHMEAMLTAYGHRLDIANYTLRKTYLSFLDTDLDALSEAWADYGAHMELQYDPDAHDVDNHYLPIFGIQSMNEAVKRKIQAHGVPRLLDFQLKRAGYDNGREGLKERCRYSTPTLRVSESSKHWMPNLHTFLEREGLRFSKV